MPAEPLEPPGLVYARFWQRAVAMVIDFAITVPVALLASWLGGHSRGAGGVSEILSVTLYLGYFIYGHGRFGRTVGKAVMGIRVVRLDGSAIGWPEAWKRSSVDIVLTAISLAGTLWALGTMSDAAFAAADGFWLHERIAAFEPAWVEGMDWPLQIWAWSELVVMLMNERRRAVHDFIAGTVVISDRT